MTAQQRRIGKWDFRRQVKHSQNLVRGRLLRLLRHGLAMHLGKGERDVATKAYPR